MKKCLFEGVATALATPFDENDINIREFEKFINFQINSGINALVVCGTTGESVVIEKKIPASSIAFGVPKDLSFNSNLRLCVKAGPIIHGYPLALICFAMISPPVT